MRIYFEKKKPFAYFGYIKFESADGKEYEISPVSTQYGSDYCLVDFEIKGTDISGDEDGWTQDNSFCEQLRGCCIVQAQLIDGEGNDVVLECLKDIFGYIRRKSVGFEAYMPDRVIKFNYFDELRKNVIKAVGNYCESEFGNFDYDDIDLKCIGLAYTEIDNEDLGYTDIPIQINLNVKSCEIVKYLAGYEVGKVSFGTLESMYLNLRHLGFDEFISIDDEEWVNFSKCLLASFIKKQDIPLVDEDVAKKLAAYFDGNVKTLHDALGYAGSYKEELAADLTDDADIDEDAAESFAQWCQDVGCDMSLYEAMVENMKKELGLKFNSDTNKESEASYYDDLEARYYEEEYDDGSSIGCKDCPDDECTGHCMSCAYRPI